MAAKTDNDKYGVFSQSSYVTVGDKYPAKGVAGSACDALLNTRHMI